MKNEEGRNDSNTLLSGRPPIEKSSQEVPNAPQIHVRPPKPVPFGSGSDASIDSKDDKDRHPSECSRQGLRRDVQMRRHTLTPQEHGFLETLAAHGDEVEVALAREKLLDDKIFFDRSFVIESDGGDGIVLERNRTSSITSSVGNERLDQDPKDVDQLKRSGDSVASVSSNKRLEHLAARRKSELHGQLWKAHENGLAVTNGASRKSVLRREKSITSRKKTQANRNELARNNSFLSTATQDLLLQGGPTDRPGENEIFRSSTSSINRARSASSRSQSVGTAPLSQTKGAGTTPKIPLRRLRSMESRKSVTFKDESPVDPDTPASETGLTSLRRKSQPSLERPLSDTADRRISEVTIDESLSNALQATLNESDPVSTMRRGAPVRSNSVSSIPSIHHAHPVRADSMSSIPSLHHGHPIRADSMSSIPSIHHGRPIRADSMSSIHSLHLGRPIRSDSTCSSLPTADAEATSKWLSQVSDKQGLNDPAWESPRPKKQDQAGEQLVRHPAQGASAKPVLLRRASVNNYDGEGIEASDWQDNDSSVLIDSLENARNYTSMVSMGSIYTSSSFDETKSANRALIFRRIGRSVSDDDLSAFLWGSTKSPIADGSSMNEVRPEDEDESWELGSEVDHYDAWNVLKDEYAVDYGINVLPFRVLGTSADDAASHPHVLSPPLMESLQPFFPYAVSEENFWMKYSLVRDGDALHTLLQNARGSKHTILALETADGEVFGSFTSTAWRKNWNYFGSGEAFLWRMRQSRLTPCYSIIDQAHLESELDVYPWTGENDCVQLCTNDKIAVGSGAPAEEREDTKDHDYGFGLAIEADLLHGTSSPCATFGSPSLSQVHSPGETFEIMNIEVWTLTPCTTVADAEKLELGKLFLEKN